MKRMLLLGCLSFVLFSCTTEELTPILEDSIESTTLDGQDTLTCEGEDPTVKITNNSLSSIDVIVFNGAGEIVSAQYDIAVGEASDWLLFAAASVRVQIINDDVSLVIPLPMELCTAYHGTLDTNNTLDTYEPYEK